MKTLLYASLFSVLVLQALFGSPSRSAAAEGIICTPQIEVHRDWGRIVSYLWPPEVATLTFRVYDPGDLVQPLYEASRDTSIDEDNCAHAYVDTWRDGFTLAPWQVLTVSDGSTTSTMTIANVAISDVDLEQDIVTGTAEAGQWVDVHAQGWSSEPYDSERQLVADESGNWTADFSVAGGHEWDMAKDLVPGTDVSAMVDDGPDHRTYYEVHIPSPYVNSAIGDELVWGSDLPKDAEVILEVDDPATITSPDLTMQGVATRDSYDPFRYSAIFDIAPLTIEAGLVLTMSDGTTTKVLNVPNLALTGYDLDADLLFGMAAPGAAVVVMATDSTGLGIWRYVQSAGDGSWLADYSVPDPISGDPACDLELPFFTQVAQQDVDGDWTYRGTLIEATPPEVASSLRADPDPTGAANVDFTVTFSEPVTGVDVSDFVLTKTGSITGYAVTNVSPASGPADTYTVSVATGQYNGTLRLDIVNDGTIQDGDGTPLASAYTDGESYTVTKTYMTTLRSQGTYDGWVRESSETSGLGGTINSTATTLQVGDSYQDRQYRSILSFSTGGLPDNAVITSAKIKVCSAGVVGTNPFNTHQGLVVDIRKPYFGSALGLQTGDFQAAASLSRVGTFGTTPSGSCYTVTLGSGSYQYVNRTGNTQFRLRFLRDDNDDLGNDYIKFYSGNYSDSSKRPVLIIKYYVP